MRISNQSQNSNTFAIAIRVIKVSVIVSLLSPSASLLAPLPLFFLPISATPLRQVPNKPTCTIVVTYGYQGLGTFVTLLVLLVQYWCFQYNFGIFRDNSCTFRSQIIYVQFSKLSVLYPYQVPEVQSSLGIGELQVALLAYISTWSNTSLHGTLNVINALKPSNLSFAFMFWSSIAIKENFFQ